MTSDIAHDKYGNELRVGDRVKRLTPCSVNRVLQVGDIRKIVKIPEDNFIFLEDIKTYGDQYTHLDAIHFEFVPSKIENWQEELK